MCGATNQISACSILMPRNHGHTNSAAVTIELTKFIKCLFQRQRESSLSSPLGTVASDLTSQLAMQRGKARIFPFFGT
jgi:hypothetical protein